MCFVTLTLFLVSGKEPRSLSVMVVKTGDEGSRQTGEVEIETETIQVNHPKRKKTNLCKSVRRT